MEKQYFKKHQFIPGTGILLIGILLSVVLKSPFEYLGFVFIGIAVLYFAVVLFLNINNSGNSKLRSRARDQTLRHQYKKR